MRRRPSPPCEQSLSDGTRYISCLVPKRDVFECFGADDRNLGSSATLREARTIILVADRSAP